MLSIRLLQQFTQTERRRRRYGNFTLTDLVDLERLPLELIYNFFALLGVLEETVISNPVDLFHPGKKLTLCGTQFDHHLPFYGGCVHLDFIFALIKQEQGCQAVKIKRKVPRPCLGPEKTLKVLVQIHEK